VEQLGRDANDRLLRCAYFHDLALKPSKAKTRFSNPVEGGAGVFQKAMNSRVQRIVQMSMDAGRLNVPGRKSSSKLWVEVHSTRDYLGASGPPAKASAPMVPTVLGGISAEFFRRFRRISVSPRTIFSSNHGTLHHALKNLDPRVGAHASSDEPENTRPKSNARS